MGKTIVRALRLRRWLQWLEFALARPVVLFAGWPLFARGWASIVNRSLNMFTLIAMGAGAAYTYSVVAVIAIHFSVFVPRGGRRRVLVLRARGDYRYAGPARSGSGAQGQKPDK